jgi:hypothetical protein
MHVHSSGAAPGDLAADDLQVVDLDALLAGETEGARADIKADVA